MAHDQSITGAGTVLHFIFLKPSIYLFTLFKPSFELLFLLISQSRTELGTVLRSGRDHNFGIVLLEVGDSSAFSLLESS